MAGATAELHRGRPGEVRRARQLGQRGRDDEPAPLSTLGEVERRFILGRRRAILATVDPHGRPRPVPICFALVAVGEAPVLVTPIDEKPKSTEEPQALARVRDIEARPDVSVLFERWSEDWAELAWLRWSGSARLVEPDDVPEDAIARLRERYPPYREQAIDARPCIVIELGRLRAWGRLAD